MITDNFPLNKLQAPVISGQTRPEAWRRLQLKRIETLLRNNEIKILDALSRDLKKPTTEGFFEIVATRQELKLAQKKLNHWMKPRHIPIPLSLKPGEAMIKPEPLGCVLIIGPWNYPFSLTLQPLISALASGNTAVLKPSEHAPATSSLISDLIQEYFPDQVVIAIEGDASVAESLTKLPFDHIFFTGGGNIGKKVMASAANHLTPITLELGGKSPAIIIDGADISVTAKRLVWGKGLNSGQTCIAPDHLIVKETIKEDLLKELKNKIEEFYGSDPTNSPDLSRIINENHFFRLKRLLDKAQSEGKVLIGGEINTSLQRIAPTVIEVNDRSDPLMEEELFGPLLPLLTVKSFEKALFDLRKEPKPLALYLFGGNEHDKQNLLNTTSSGSVCFNDVVIQAGIPDLPFGGVGASGIGQYHGLAGFETFSHKKTVLKRPFWLDLNFRYPPYRTSLKLLKKLLR